MESGTPDVKSTTDGWLNRYLATRGTCEECVVGAAPTAIPRRRDDTANSAHTQRTRANHRDELHRRVLHSHKMVAMPKSALRRCIGTGNSDLVHGSGSEMFEALRVLKSANPQQYKPAAGIEYPKTQFGQRLSQIAQLIKSDVGLEIAFADIGGWDTHVNQGAANGQLAQRLTDFSGSIASLVADLGDRMNDVVIITMSEFGRTARQNGTGGTDHGHAGAMFVLGGSLKAPRTVHGKWPGLAPEQLNEGRDLALTTDFRSVFSEVASKHLGATAMDKMFPGFAVDQTKWVGLL